MGLFKSKEEKMRERKELKRRIKDSLMTQMIQNVLIEKYGELDSEETRKLRQLSSCQLEVEKDGFTFVLKNESGEIVDGWGMSFDALGYEDLSKAGVYILKDIMLDTLRDIPHLTVMDSGYIMYNTDRPKNAW